MNTEQQQEVAVHEVELNDACVCCGGPVTARFTPGTARGVCLVCHLVTPMMLVKGGEGVRVVQGPFALA